MNTELVAKIAVWRERAARGDMTPAEYREVIEQLREGRVAAAATSAKSRAAKAAKAPVNSDDLLSQLDGL